MYSFANPEQIQEKPTVKTVLDGNKVGITSFGIKNQSLTSKEKLQQAIIGIDGIVDHYLEKIWQQYIKTKIELIRKEQIEVDANLQKVANGQDPSSYNINIDFSIGDFTLFSIQSITNPETGETFVIFAIGHMPDMSDELSRLDMKSNYNQKIIDHKKEMLKHEIEEHQENRKAKFLAAMVGGNNKEEIKMERKRKEEEMSFDF